GSWLAVAQIANRAAVGGSGSRTDRFEFATRAIAAATNADSPLELARAFRARSQTPLGATHQSFEDLRLALAAAERHTKKSGDAWEELLTLRDLALEHQL